MREPAGSIFALFAVALLILAAFGLYRFVQFWIEFARGMNEARGEQKGFAVNLKNGSPVTKKAPSDKERD